MALSGRSENLQLQQLTELFSRGAIGSNPNGESFAYFAGERRSREVCVFLNVALDNSGSMLAKCGAGGKSRLQVALDCLDNIVHDKTLDMSVPDSLVVHTFNDDVIIRLCCHPAGYDHARLVQGINANFGGSSDTRMRDAIMDALRNMLKHPERTRFDKKTGKDTEVLRYLLVLTDGADTRSQTSPDALLGALNDAAGKLNNLHLVIIALGMGDRAVTNLEHLCRGRVPVKVFNVTKVDDISVKDAFAKAMEHLRALLRRSPNGKIVTTHVATRNLQEVQALDQQAAISLQRFQSHKLVTNNKEVKAMLALMN